MIRFRPNSRSKTSSLSGRRVSGRILGYLLILPVAIGILFAVWLAAASIVENIRFGRSADQIIDLVSTARNFAAREQNFAMQPGEDVLASLAHAGLMSINSKTTPLSLINPWEGTVTVVITRPLIMRIETAVPARNCRRLAMFFSKDVKGMGVQLIEARQGTQGIWRRFYDRQNVRIPREEDVEAACDQAQDETLALVLGLR